MILTFRIYKEMESGKATFIVGEDFTRTNENSIIEISEVIEFIQNTLNNSLS